MQCTRCSLAGVSYCIIVWESKKVMSMNLIFFKIPCRFYCSPTNQWDIFGDNNTWCDVTSGCGVNSCDNYCPLPLQVPLPQRDQRHLLQVRNQHVLRIHNLSCAMWFWANYYEWTQSQSPMSICAILYNTYQMQCENEWNLAAASNRCPGCF